MPVYNAEQTVMQAIRSIQRQTFTAWELIVIDDGSRDRTREIVASAHDPRIRLIAGETNRQLPYRLNQCVQLARGRYFARMDGDDISFPERLELQLDYFRKHPEVDLLGGAIVVFRSDGSIVSVPSPFLDHDTICGPIWARFRLAHPTWFGEREWFRQNPYDDSQCCTQDRGLMLRTHRKARFAAVPNLVLAYRHDSAPLAKTVPMRFEYARALLKDGLQHREPGRAVVAIAIEACKLGLDLGSFCLHSNHRYAEGTQRVAGAGLDPGWRNFWSELNAA